MQLKTCEELKIEVLTKDLYKIKFKDSSGERENSGAQKIHFPTKIIFFACGCNIVMKLLISTNRLKCDHNLHKLISQFIKENVNSP